MNLIVLAVPYNAAPGSQGEPETRLKNWIQSEVGAEQGISSIALPDLKIGTLDNLVVQSEEVARLDGQLQQIVLKIHETMQGMFPSAQQVAKAELVNGRSPAEYLQQFGWNTAKFRPDRQISMLLSMFSEEAFAADADLRQIVQQHQQTKSALQQVERRQQGDLTVRALDKLVSERNVILGSEYLESILLVVPKQLVKTFLGSYERLSSMVVPRSATKIAEEGEQVLYSVAVFRKFAEEFATKARENKFVPRELPNVNEGDDATNEADIQSVTEKEARLRKQACELASASFADVVNIWGHVKVVRLFVESVLRYGLPPSFLTAAFVPSVSTAKAVKALVDKFGYLGGNAVTRDKKGRAKDDSDLGEYGALVEHDYKPFVIYTMELP